MQKFNFNNPGGLLNLNPNDTGSLGINISPINEQKKLEEEERKRAERSRKLQNLADTFNMIGANQSGDTQRMAFHSNRLAQRKAEQEARQLKAQEELEARTLKEQQDMEIRNYFGDNENLATVAKIAGVPTAINMQQRQIAQQKLIQEQNAQAEINALQERRKIDAYTNAGYTEGQAFAIVVGGAKPEDVINVGIDEDAEEENRQIESLINAGYSKQEAEAIAIAGLEPSELRTKKDVGITLGEIRNQVDIERSTKDEITKKAPADDLANLKEAHGSNFIGGDAFQENVVNKAGRFFGLEPADITGAAIRGKKDLDERVLQITTQNYSGRPSVFLLEQIKTLIPPINTSDKDAAESYLKIYNRVDGYLDDLEREINSGEFSGSELANMKTDYRRLYSLSEDLKTAVGGLYDTDKVSTKSDTNTKSKGLHNNYFLNEGNAN
jgi:hypothetical protein